MSIFENYEVISNQILQNLSCVLIFGPILCPIWLILAQFGHIFSFQDTDSVLTPRIFFYLRVQNFLFFVFQTSLVVACLTLNFFPGTSTTVGTHGKFWFKHTEKGMIAHFHICWTVFDRHLEFISQSLLPKGDQKIFDFNLFHCSNLAFLRILLVILCSHHYNNAISVDDSFIVK